MATEGNGNNGRARPPARLFDLLSASLTALPPAFLLVALLNVACLGVAVWLIEGHTDARLQLLDKIVERCLSAAPR